MVQGHGIILDYATTCSTTVVELGILYMYFYIFKLFFKGKYVTFGVFSEFLIFRF